VHNSEGINALLTYLLLRNITKTEFCFVRLLRRAQLLLRMALRTTYSLSQTLTDLNLIKIIDNYFYFGSFLNWLEIEFRLYLYKRFNSIL
jgi:hypothetical protein